MDAERACFELFAYAYGYVLHHVVDALVALDAYELAARFAAPWCGQ